MGFGEAFGPTRPKPDVQLIRQATSSGVAADLIDLLLPLWQRAAATEPGQGVAESSNEVFGTTLALAQLWDMVTAWEEFTALTRADPSGLT